MNKVIVAGSRSVVDEDWVHAHLDRILADVEPGEIVSGTCRGPDTFGEHWATKAGWAIKRFPADWDKFGRSAGPRRNSQMAEYGTHLVAFLDVGSRGTKSMIGMALEQELHIRIIRTDEEKMT